jgi:exopolysaccharide biosynthesis polyprenyl glycosylphosphotransferase
MKPKEMSSKTIDASYFQESRRTDSGINHGPMELDNEILPENIFLNKLCSERKRTNRSEKPFLLILIDIDHATKPEHDPEILKNILSVLVSSKRETDICGWYQQGHMIGMIYTEIAGMETQEAREAISSKIHRRLSDKIPTEVTETISIIFHYYPEKYDEHTTKCNLFEKNLYPDLQPIIATKTTEHVIKRIIDIVGSSLAILIFSPLICLISLCIVMTSKGPVLFRQERLGQFGKKFTFLKFRSMHVHTDDSIHREYIKKLITENRPSEENNDTAHPPVYKIRNDPRVTTVGRLLRKTSLDELPQLLNVFKGDMSLVGPRPAIPYEYESYDIWHRYRLLQVKPGITGLWQVTSRSSASFDEMVRLDLRYIQEWSLWLDFKILLLTPWVVIKGKGAY